MAFNGVTVLSSPKLRFEANTVLLHVAPACGIPGLVPLLPHIPSCQSRALPVWRDNTIGVSTTRKHRFEQSTGRARMWLHNSAAGWHCGQAA